MANLKLNEDGESVSKEGLGSAAIGNLLLGVVGAVVGSVTGIRKQKTMVDKLYILAGRYFRHIASQPYSSNSGVHSQCNQKI